MKEYDPESGTYRNKEIDPETKEVRYGECNPDDDEEVVYRFQKIRQLKIKLHHKWWFWCICAFVLIVPWIVLLSIQHHKSIEEKNNKEELKNLEERVQAVQAEVSDNNAGTLTIIDSSKNGDSYTIIIDTTFQDHNLKIYNVHYGIPELYVCDSLDIDTADRNIIFAARAADVSEKFELVGFFIDKGEVLATGSKGKEGFCAIINHNITLGTGKTTPLLEQAIDEKGYFFRNPPLVINGIPQERARTKCDSRRALCSFNNEIVYIVCDEKMTLTEFAQLLSDFGVETAVNMVGSKGGNGFCRDQEGKLHQWGVNRYFKYKNINYLIWKKK